MSLRTSEIQNIVEEQVVGLVIETSEGRQKRIFSFQESDASLAKDIKTEWLECRDGYEVAGFHGIFSVRTSAPRHYSAMLTICRKGKYTILVSSFGQSPEQHLLQVPRIHSKFRRYSTLDIRLQATLRIIARAFLPRVRTLMGRVLLPLQY